MMKTLTRRPAGVSNDTNLAVATSLAKKAWKDAGQTKDSASVSAMSWQGMSMILNGAMSEKDYVRRCTQECADDERNPWVERDISLVPAEVIVRAGGCANRLASTARAVALRVDEHKILILLEDGDDTKAKHIRAIGAAIAPFLAGSRKMSVKAEPFDIAAAVPPKKLEGTQAADQKVTRAPKGKGVRTRAASSAPSGELAHTGS